MAGTADSFEKLLAQANLELKSGNTRVQIEQRGSRLSLVAFLPNKEGGDKRTRRISPKLPANAVGLKEIKRLALKLAGDLTTDRFSWADWTDKPQSKPTTEKDCADWCKEYRAYLEHSGAICGQEGQRDRQWRRDYWNPALKWLPQDQPLTPGAIVIGALRHDAVDQNGTPRRSRQLACIRLGQFARWAGIDVDLKPYRGKYSPAQVKREIPSDSVIESGIASISNKDWQWVAGVMAAFGLRDHECWYAEIGRDPVGWFCRVRDGKTGARLNRPFPPEWVDEWGLAKGKPPGIKVRGHSEYGERVARHFKRSGVGFCPYDLRHAYAIRGSLIYSVPVSVMAAFMGHSPAVFLRIYSKHLSVSVMDAAYLEGLSSAGDRGNLRRETDSESVTQGEGDSPD